MGQQHGDILMGLATFLALSHMSRSAERRHRRETEDWPPHIEIGRRVFYRRAAVMEWLERQEAKQVSAG
jgi:predicted DNA-binding transcriptional regulator AlpA